MARKSRRPKRWQKPRLTISIILAWADQHYRENGRWPHHFSGRIKSAGEETWSRVNDALAKGYRGLLGGSSLARELFRHRGVRSPGNVPPLNEREILAWAQAHFQRTKKWPTLSDGAIRDAPSETWAAVDLALARGRRGLPGGSSIAQLLAARGVKRNPQRLPRLAPAQILDWADAFFQAHGHWPYRESGPIVESAGETWLSLHKALQRGSRGLAGKSTLAAFLNAHRGIFRGKSRRPKRLNESKRLRIDQIVAWGKAHRLQTGNWPNRDSGPIPKSGLNWSAVDSALKCGSRGLSGGSSLAKLFGGRRKPAVS